ncbi:MAG: D-2-hydroxyacid dehydrogenase [Bryobacterales bacterium]|nr:D-2-hydroxyacid dehydrogenase [Acidobacteriota bacterium]MCB9385304.1 D-2-hydroxyacid dehydrogenase [Bryobacterales bacterium]
MPLKLVIYPNVDAPRLEQIRRAAGEMQVVNCADEERAVDEMPDADAFFGKLTPRLLAASTKLRWVQSPTASLEHYVFPELVGHPCELTNMRGLFSDAIADQVFGYIVCFSRNLHIYIRRQKEGRWDPVGGESGRPSFATGPGEVGSIDRAHPCLSDMTLGIVGLGYIGEEVARRGACFGMRVLAVDARRQVAPEGVEAVSPTERLDDLLAASDFVVIAAPHTPQTEGLFDLERMRKMKPSGVLINIGRGVIVKLDALVEALSAGVIGGAALDVFEQEPLPADHPLWQMDNVILTPHVAGFSPKIAERHLGVVLDNVERFVAGKPLRNVVDKAQWF